MVILFILYGVNDGLVPRAPPSFPSFAVWKAMRIWMEVLCIIAHVRHLDKQEFLLDPDCSMVVISVRVSSYLSLVVKDHHIIMVPIASNTFLI